MKFPRALLIGVWIATMVAACSRPASPVLGPDANTAVDEAASAGWTSALVNEPQTARARLRIVGTVVQLGADFRTHLKQNAEYLVDVEDPLILEGQPPAVPAHSVLKQVRWRVPGTGAVRYIVDNNPQIRIDPSPFPRPPGVGFPPGAVLFTLLAPERAGGGSIQVVLQANLASDMWWAGPDPSRFPLSSDGDGRAVDVLDWAHFSTSPAWPPDGRGYFGPDSFRVVPHERLPVNSDMQLRTFYELWGDRIYARSEGDAVHLGSWLVFSTGGFDPDSPYTPIVAPGAPTLPAGYESQPDLYSLLIAQGLIGSPIGFLHRVPVRLANGQLSQPSESTSHPNFDIASVFYSPVVASYWLAQFPGKAYAIVTPVDGDGLVARTLEDLVALADRVDAGGGSAQDLALRRRVLTFEVRATEVATKASLARGR